MTTHFHVLKFIKENPEWAVAIAQTYLVNSAGAEVYNDAPVNEPIGRVHMGVDGDLFNYEFPIITEEYDVSGVIEELADIAEFRLEDGSVVYSQLEDIFKSCVDKVIRDVVTEAGTIEEEYLDKDLRGLIDVNFVGEDEHGIKVIEVTTFETIDTIALAAVMSKRRILSDVYSDLF